MKKNDFCDLLKLFGQEKKLHIIQQLFYYLVKSYENCWALNKNLVHITNENFKGKNKNCIHIELSKIAMLPPNYNLIF